MVAVGNNRNNGLNLGSFCYNANNGLGNSNGNNWRSRIPLIARAERRRPGSLTESETPLKADDRSRLWRGRAVKDSARGRLVAFGATRRPARRAAAHKGREGS